MLTAKEVARYLNINEKAVYRLVKDGRIPGTRVTGKWTFSRSLVKQWIESQSLYQGGSPAAEAIPLLEELLIAGSNDLVLESLIAALKQETPELLPYFANVGSCGGLEALQKRRAHIAGVHLYHPDSGQYNLPYLREILPAGQWLVFNLAYRVQGFIFRSKRGRSFRSAADLAEPEVRFINRELGSGTRLLLDHLLREEGVDPSDIKGYSWEAFTHMEVGLAILRKEADVGLGIQPVAELLGLAFHPITTERYDLVVPVDNLPMKSLQALFNLIHSRKFLELGRKFPGYDLRDGGKMLS